eukprot:364395-Chlamydomonas_euryale.AAC.2
MRSYCVQVLRLLAEEGVHLWAPSSGEGPMTGCVSVGALQRGRANDGVGECGWVNVERRGAPVNALQRGRANDGVGECGWRRGAAVGALQRGRANDGVGECGWVNVEGRGAAVGALQRGRANDGVSSVGGGMWREGVHLWMPSRRETGMKRVARNDVFQQWQHFSGLPQLPGHNELIPWPEVRAAATEGALDRQAWQDANTNLAPLEFKKPQQVGCMT